MEDDQKQKPIRIACPQCDLYMELPPRKPKQSAACPQCHHPLAAPLCEGLQKPLALAIAALCFLVMANCFPFLAFKASGREQVMTLAQSAWELYHQGSEILALLVFGFIVAVPAGVLIGILFLITAIALHKKRPAYKSLARFVFGLNAWAMADVFFVGALVSLTKIASMAKVIFGLSFWFYGAFAIMFVCALRAIDRRAFWEKLTGVSDA